MRHAADTCVVAAVELFLRGRELVDLVPL